MLQSTAIFPLLPPTGDGPDWQLSAPGTFEGQWTEDLAGMVAIAAQIRFFYGSGGTAVKLLLQSSLDQGNSAYNVAALDFGQVDRPTLFAVQQATTGILTPSSGSVAEGIITSVLGDRLRMVAIVTGTYVNTTLSGRFQPS